MAIDEPRDEKLTPCQLSYLQPVSSNHENKTFASSNLWALLTASRSVTFFSTKAILPSSTPITLFSPTSSSAILKECTNVPTNSSFPIILLIFTVSLVQCPLINSFLGPFRQSIYLCERSKTKPNPTADLPKPGTTVDKENSTR